MSQPNGQGRASPVPETQPDPGGHFGRFGGRFAPEALMAALDELTAAYASAQADPQFQAELAALLSGYAGRPTPLTAARRFGARGGRLPGAAQARGPRPHRLSQDQ